MRDLCQYIYLLISYVLWYGATYSALPFILTTGAKPPFTACTEAILLLRLYFSNVLRYSHDCYLHSVVLFRERDFTAWRIIM
jgi:hypothetical protein